MPEEILRTFIAIELDEPILIAIGRVQKTWKKLAPQGSVKWVSTQAMHLTLKFLSDTPRSRVREVSAALTRACTEIQPFEISIEGRGCFPNCRRPRVLWLGVREQGQMLRSLQAAIEEQVAPLGWPTEPGKFVPPMTLGRIARSTGRPQEEAVGRLVENSVVEQVGLQRVTRVHYIRSELQPGGPVYTTLAVVPLTLETVSANPAG
jgi:RNA 2',3'-cyclic 3'-phosphodiesterase